MSAVSLSFPFNSFQTGIGPAAAYYQSVSQSIPDVTFTTLLFQIKEFDTDNAFNINTGIFLPKVAGIYQINAATSGGFSTSIYKNGAAHKRGADLASLSSLVVLNGNDYIQIRAYQSTGTPLGTSAGVSLTYFNAAWIRGL
jgi:hypothetical protein